ncbi:unnamed protein product [Orchesella dallaii]|uniref:Uncharacterized protein n=1 Tax=Orchesella dallaii TaxID=48710 RepID=A0ABP1R8U0_9HEXA
MDSTYWDMLLSNPDRDACEMLLRHIHTYLQVLVRVDNPIPFSTFFSPAVRSMYKYITEVLVLTSNAMYPKHHVCCVRCKQDLFHPEDFDQPSGRTSISQQNRPADWGEDTPDGVECEEVIQRCVINTTK